jgi:hypothetical protein
MQDPQPSQRNYYLRVEIQLKNGNSTAVRASKFDLNPTTDIAAEMLDTPQRVPYKGISGDEQVLILIPSELAAIVVSEEYR